MKHFDIDSLDPCYPESPFATARRKRPLTMKERRAGYIHLWGSGYSSCRIGVKPETMRNWRALETRMSSLHAAWKDTSRKLWREVARLRAERGLKGKNDTLVVVIDPPTAPGVDRTIIKFSEGCYSLDTAGRLLSDKIERPHQTNDFSLVKYEEGGDVIGRLYHREGRLHRSSQVYLGAFRRAVSDRLEVKRKAGMTYNTYYVSYEPALYIVENDGRQHPVAINLKGEYIWLEGEMYLTKKETSK